MGKKHRHKEKQRLSGKGIKKKYKIDEMKKQPKVSFFFLIFNLSAHTHTHT